MVISSSRSSGSWFILLPVPSQYARETYLVNRILCEKQTLHDSRTTLHCHASGIAGFRPH